MSASATTRKPAQRRSDNETEGAQSEQAIKDRKEQGDALKAGIDALLDEIDAVLEENAETFVKNYVQKGGQ